MKKIFLTAFMLIGIVGFSQQKKKVYKKKPIKKTTVAKTQTVVKQEPTVVIAEEPKVETIVEEPKVEIIVEEPKVEDMPYVQKANKVLKTKGWINNRNSYYERGIEGFVKGVYSSGDKIYILAEIANRSNIPYAIESVAFLSNTVMNRKFDRQSGVKGVLDEKEEIYIPIYEVKPDVIEIKSSKKMVFVFDKFTISNYRDLKMVVSESDADRSLYLEIKPQYFTKAEFIK